MWVYAFCLVCWIANIVSCKLTFDYHQTINNRHPPLQDFIHSIIPFDERALYVSDTLNIISIALTYVDGIYRECAYTFTLFMMFRLVLIHITALPASSPLRHNTSVKNPWRSYNDLILSGHAAVAAIPLNFATTPWVIALLWVLLVVTSLCQLIGRVHYTIDILLGMYVSFTIPLVAS